MLSVQAVEQVGHEPVGVGPRQVLRGEKDAVVDRCGELVEGGLDVEGAAELTSLAGAQKRLPVAGALRVHDVGSEGAATAGSC